MQRWILYIRIWCNQWMVDCIIMQHQTYNTNLIPTWWCMMKHSSIHQLHHICNMWHHRVSSAYFIHYILLLFGFKNGVCSFVNFKLNPLLNLFQTWLLTLEKKNQIKAWIHCSHLCKLTHNFIIVTGINWYINLL